MERARFFKTLRWGRTMKRAGYTRMERWIRMFNFQYGFESGWRACCLEI